MESVRYTSCSLQLPEWSACLNCIMFEILSKVSICCSWLQGDNVTVSSSLTASGIPKVAALVASINSHQSPTALPSSPVPGSTPEPDGQGEGLDKDHSVGHSTPPVSRGQHVPVPRGRGRVAGRIRGSLRLGRSKSGTEGGEWTGAGFDVDDGAP